MNMRLVPLFAAVAALALGGCASMRRINHEAVQRHDTAEAVTNSKLVKLRVYNRDTGPTVVISQLPYVNSDPVQYDANYPAHFSSSASLRTSRQSVSALMRQLQVATGYSVTAAGGLERVIPHSKAAASRGAAGPRMVEPLAYSGTIKGLFDRVASALDATWSYKPALEQVRFYRYETQVFHVATVPGAAGMSSVFGDSGGRAVKGLRGQAIRVSSAQAKNSFAAKLSVWSTLKKNITPMLSRYGTLAISEPTASVTVHDRWDHVAQVATYIHTLNRSLTMQVKISVSVYRVTDTQNDSRGINWQILYDALGQAATQYGLEVTTPRLAGQGLSSLILSSPMAKNNGTPAPFAGSKLFIDALSRLGKASVVKRTTVITVNNTPAPVQVVQSKGYLAKTTGLYSSGVQQGQTQTVGAGASLIPGSVQTGFSLSILPSVQPGGQRLLLQIMLSLSSLDSLKPVKSGGQLIQVPTVSSRQFMPRVWMRSGQSLVLAGFEGKSTNHDVATPFSKHTWLLGGNRTVDTRDSALVIVMTPVVTSHASAF